MKNDRINSACVLKYEHSSCNHLYNQLIRKELLNRLIHFLFCPTFYADTWRTSTVYIDNFAPHSSSLSGSVAFLFVQIVTVRTLREETGFLHCCVRGKVLWCVSRCSGRDYAVVNWLSRDWCHHQLWASASWLTVLLSLRKVAVMECFTRIAYQAWEFQCEFNRRAGIKDRKVVICDLDPVWFNEKNHVLLISIFYWKSFRRQIVCCGKPHNHH